MMHKKLSLLLGLFPLAFSFSTRKKRTTAKTKNSELKKQIAAINATFAKARGEAKLSLCLP